ncbi:MAG TPA: N-acyl homoserine lactonase family protein [Candidatus Binataceae bacterium]|nr:N-acyl homoserine lactonase family protein [Candidatus Binataceae bacterium]
MAEGKAKRMWALPGAEFIANAAAIMHGGSLETYAMPVPCYLIEHEKGLVLFDTGCSPRMIDHLNEYLGEFAKVIRLRFSKDLVVDAQVRALGYKTEDVKYVVVSHLHFDHAGGLYLFPKARFLVMANELRYAWWPIPEHRLILNINDLLPSRNFNWLEVDGDYDLFGDGSIQMLKTPGHTPGECSLFVRLPNRKVVLTGDTTHLRAALEGEITMPGDVDPAAAVLSMQRLKAIRDLQEAALIISHDPEDWAEFPHAPAPIE